MLRRLCPALPSYPQAIVRVGPQWTDYTPGRCKIMCIYIGGVVMGLMVRDGACYHSMELQSPVSRGDLSSHLFSPAVSTIIP